MRHPSLVLLVVLAAACGPAAAERGAEPSVPSPSACSEAPKPWWSYETPGEWGSLPGCPLCAVCATGDRQSPIELLVPPPVPAPAADAPELDFSHARVKAWVNNGHTLETRFLPGSTLTVARKPYTLVNVHFHVPAEHLVGKKRYAMEMHAVTMDNPDAATAAKVFGVFFDEGPGSPAIGELFARFPPAEHHQVCTHEAPSGTTLNLSPLVPQKTALWAYDGSLTVPSCTQFVTFYLAQEPLSVSKVDLDTFKKRVGVEWTARPEQTRNRDRREVRDIKAP